VHNSVSSMRVCAWRASLVARSQQQFRPGDLDGVIQRLGHALVCQSALMGVKRRRKGLRIVIRKDMKPGDKVERDDLVLPAQLDHSLVKINKLDPVQDVGHQHDSNTWGQPSR
jgi:hypothetical protein